VRTGVGGRAFGVRGGISNNLNAVDYGEECALGQVRLPYPQPLNRGPRLSHETFGFRRTFAVRRYKGAKTAGYTETEH
jgi:hypothetical protein